MNKQFDSTKFYNSFNITIKALAESERITKDALRSLSRECLMLIHYESKNQGDISPVNKVMSVLTPRNKSAWKFFMQAFTGFSYDKNTETFTKKDKQRYEDCFFQACEFLEDEAFDLWAWAKDNLEDKVKASPLEQLGKAVKRALEAKDKELGVHLYKKSDIIKAVMDNGLTADDLIDILQAMDVVEVK